MITFPYLTPRESEVFSELISNRIPKESIHLLGVSESYFKVMVHRVYKKHNVQFRFELQYLYINQLLDVINDLSVQLRQRAA